jgi:hypothetical protein
MPKFVVKPKEVWYVCGEIYEYDDDGEAIDGNIISDFLYKGDEASAKKYFKDCVDKNHRFVKAGKGKEMDYHRYELFYETKDDTEYVEYAWWCPIACSSQYSFDASF